jgi:hypothetical protein
VTVTWDEPNSRASTFRSEVTPASGCTSPAPGTVATIKATAILLPIFALIGPPPTIEPFIHLLAMMSLGWIFSCLIGWIGIVLSLARRVPVCIIPDLKRRCCGDLENLRELTLPVRSFDRTILIVASSLSIPFLSISFLSSRVGAANPAAAWPDYLPGRPV